MTPVQCKMARAALGLGTRELAAQAHVPPAVVLRFEAGGGAYMSTVDALRAVLEAEGIQFLPDNGSGPGLRVKKGPRP